MRVEFEVDQIHPPLRGICGCAFDKDQKRLFVAGATYA